jgi:hypothetical protein
LKADPTAVVELYPNLTKEIYSVLVRPSSGTELAVMEFLTYPSLGDVRELPAFTGDKWSLLKHLQQQSEAEIISVDGLSLFKRLLDVVKEREVELAINPGWEYGIRLTRPMLLSAIAASRS